MDYSIDYQKGFMDGMEQGREIALQMHDDGLKKLKAYEDDDKTVYEAVKLIFSHLGLDKKISDDQFKKLSGRYKDYLIEEAKSW